MSILAHFKTVCDNCGLTIERDVPLNSKTAQDIMEEEDHGSGMNSRSYATDMWSWAIPDGWIQVPFDEVTKRQYLFFHSDECYSSWLRGQGREAEVLEWIA